MVTAFASGCEDEKAHFREMGTIRLIQKALVKLMLWSKLRITPKN